MIVLFNTAYRPGYLQNILRTGFLPVGATNQYRYTLSETGHVTNEMIADFRSLGSQRVLVCFGDRFSEGGYTFHPLRLGKLEKIEEAGSKAYFEVRFGQHVSCADPQEFSKRLYALNNKARDALLKLTNEDPYCATDGRYVVHFKDEDVDPLLQVNEFSWSAAVVGLASTKAFASTDERKFVFAKCELLANGRTKQYSASGDVNRYELEKDDDARLVISYYFPGQQADRAALANVSVTSPSGLQILGANEYSLDMVENRIAVPIAFEPNSDKRFFTIDTKFSSSQSGVEVIGPQETVAMKVHETAWRQVLAAFCALIYIGGAMSAASGAAAWGEFLKGAGLIGFFLIFGGKKIV